MEARAHGADGTIDMAGGLRIIETFEIAQDDDFAIVRRQIEYGGAQILEVLLFTESVEEFAARGGGFGVVDESLAFTEARAQHVAGNADEIGLQTSLLWRKGVAILYERQEDFLHNFLGGFHLAGHI